MEIQVGKKYKNQKKGGIYKVIGIGKHSETLEDLVFYEALYDNPIKFWARPVTMWFEEITLPDGTKGPRYIIVE